MKHFELILFSFFYFLPFAFTSCKSTYYDGGKQTKDRREFVLKESKSTLQDSVLFKSITVLPLEADGEKGAKFIDRIYFDDNVIFTLNKSSELIDIYDSKGHHIKAIKKIGYGPQEVRHLADICIDKVNKELVVLSSEPSKILYFSYQGEFLRERTLSTYFESIATDGQFIYLLDSNVINGEKAVTIYNKDFTQVREALEVNRNFRGPATCEFMRPALGNQMTQDEKIHITKKLDNKIYVAEKGKISTEYSLDFQQSSLPDTLLEKKMKLADFFKICGDNDYIATITDVIENDKLLLFKTNVGFCVCNKQNGSMAKYRQIEDSVTGLILKRIQTVGNTSDKMAVVWPLNYIKNIMELHSRNSSGKDMNMEFFNQLMSLNNECDAILVIYEF